MSEIIPVFEDYGQFQSSAVRGAQAARVMMMLGDFAFSIDTTVYNQLTREASWRWSEQERIGKQDLLQYTGKPGRTVRLEGGIASLSFARGWMLLTISSMKRRTKTRKRFTINAKTIRCLLRFQVKHPLPG